MTWTYSGAKVQFYCVDQRNEPHEQGLMHGMLDIGVKRG